MIQVELLEMKTIMSKMKNTLVGFIAEEIFRKKRWCTEIHNNRNFPK